jgi:hypothetical protein
MPISPIVSRIHTATTPPDRDSWWRWCERHLTLPSAYAVPGPFRASKWMRDVIDAVQADDVREVWLLKNIQGGGSLVADVLVPCIAVNDPGPIMWTFQADEDAKEHVKMRWWALANSCAPFVAMLPPNRHDKNTTEVYFGGFSLLINGANLNNLQSKSIRWKINDELWLPQWQTLYQHAKGRVSAFEEKKISKILNISQAGNAGDVMDRGYRSGSQKVWSYPTDSGELVPLLFGGEYSKDEYIPPQADAGAIAGRGRWGIVFADDAKRTDGTYDVARAVETVRYRCKVTGKEYPDTPATRAFFSEQGAFQSMNPSANPEVESFWINALLTRPMGMLVSEFLDATHAAKAGNIQPMRDYVMKREARPWVEQVETLEIVDSGRGNYSFADYHNGEEWPGEVDRFMTIDRQRGRGGDVPHWWVEVRAWKADGDSRQLYFGRVETVEAVEEIRERLRVSPRKTIQDAGYDQNQVYQDSVRFGWMCWFGDNRASWDHVDAQGNRIKLPYSPIQRTAIPGVAVPFLRFAQDYGKDVLSRLLAGKGQRWETAKDTPPAYYEHCRAERKREVRPGVWKWQKIYDGKDNHGWDCSVMQVMLAIITKRLGMPKVQESNED